MNMRIKSILTAILLILVSTGAYAQEGGAGTGKGGKRSISGRVTDNLGQVLIGAGITCQESKKATITDINGDFTIAIPENGVCTLTFTFLGMAKQSVALKGTEKRLDIVMSADNTLESAVIVGAYGTVQRREDLTGSAFQINADALQNKPAARVDNLLEGLIPGMTIEPNTDDAGSTRTRYQTRIRGEGSLSGSSEPLWIVDGVPQYMGSSTGTMPGMSYTISPMSYLNVEDIESITVLKDADQVSIYGANGANGVILVTTKGGKKNTPLRANASVRFGVASIDKSTMFKVMNASQYMEVAKEAWVNSGELIENFPYQDNEYNSYSTTSTNWPDVYLGLGDEITANVSLAYGTQKVTGRVSGSYYRKDNTIKTDNQTRFTLSTKNDFEFIRNVHLAVGLNASYNINNLFPVSSASYLETQPIFSPYLEDGTTFRLYNRIWDSTKNKFVDKSFYYNYVPDREYNDNRQRTVVTDANFNLYWNIIEGLKISNLFGVKYNSGHEDTYAAKTTLRGMDGGVGVGSSTRRDVSYLSWNNNTTIDFNRRFGKHHVKALAGLELISQQNKYSYISGYGFMNDKIKEIEYAEKVSSYSYTNVKNTREMSYFGRAEYGYDDRYIVTGNIRRNGNSIFGKYSKWGTFWSVGASWNIHKEHFWNVSWMKFLKLKASYGKAGNSKIDATTATGTYSYSDSNSYMGVAGGVIGSVPNPGLSWETTYQANCGISMDLFDGLEIEVEAYDYITKDLLSKVYVSRTISEDRQYANLGKMRNSGVEISIAYDVIHKQDWNWNIRFNAAHNKNKILELYNGMPTSFGSTIWMEGYSSDTHMLIRWAGVDPLDGSPLWYDKEGNLTKVYDYDNRVPGKTSNPDLSGGLTNVVRWKNLTLSVQLNYSIGGWANPSYGLKMMDDGYDIISSNKAVEIYYYRWKQPGDLTSFPRVTNESLHSVSYNDRFLMNKTNFNISNLSLTYNLPDKAISAMKIKGMGINFICDNVYLFTLGMSKDFNSYKTMRSGYPVTRTFTLGLNMSF